MPNRPIVLIHGYSDDANGFSAWKKIIEKWGIHPKLIYVGNYISLSNEISIKDIAEGLDRALLNEAGIPPDAEFDAIVHSTGMLVIRSWLNSYASGATRRARLKHLIALAPATNGSPLAKQGRSTLGAVFKGNKVLGPDFMEAGDEVLYGLELASDFTWKLAHDDLINDNARFKSGPDTPFVFTFCGNERYGFLKNLVTKSEGSDGTVRWAGCALNSRKIDIDLMISSDKNEPEIKVSEWANQEQPLILVDKLNHGTIMSEPSALLQDLVKSALSIEANKELLSWIQDAETRTAAARKKIDEWQQFVIKITDERGDPVKDWHLELFADKATNSSLEEFDVDVHVYTRDESLRCFHVNLTKLDPSHLKQLELRLIASSGTPLIEYHGYGSERIAKDGQRLNSKKKYDAKINLTKYLQNQDFNLFYPFTTTFVEIRINREPMTGENSVYWFVKNQ